MAGSAATSRLAPHRAARPGAGVVAWAFGAIVAACLVTGPAWAAAGPLPGLPDLETTRPAPQTAPGAHLVVVVGATIDDVNGEVFHNWAVQIVDAATAGLGLPRDRVTYLGPDPELDTESIDGRSDRETIEATLARLAEEAGVDDRVVVVLIGHGTGEGEQSRFNIPGRDITALEYDAMLDRFVTQQIAFVNTASASGDFAAVLSGANRVVITATRDAHQNNQTVFPRFFAESLSADVSDVDKDGRVSMLEAYNYASREVKRFYEDDGRMLTETSKLEDNGDGDGAHEPTGGDVDGSLAALLFLDSPAAAMTGEGAATEDPELLQLYAQQRQLRVRLEELRRLKDTMDPELYESELEDLLLELARTDQQIRDKGGGQ